MPVEFVGAVVLVIMVAASYSGVLLWCWLSVAGPKPRETYRYGDLKVPQFGSHVRLADLVRKDSHCTTLCHRTCCIDDVSISCTKCVLYDKNSVSRSEFLSRVGRTNSYKGLMIPRADPSLELIDALRNCYECTSSAPEQRCQGLQCIPGAVCDQCLACATHVGVLKDYLKYTEGEKMPLKEYAEVSSLSCGYCDQAIPTTPDGFVQATPILYSFNGIVSDANILKRIDNKKEDGKLVKYFKGLRVPDQVIGRRGYTTVADVMMDGHVEDACQFVNCIGLSCTDCALNWSSRRRELAEFFMNEKEKNEMKKAKQSVAEGLVSKFPASLGTDSTFSITAYSCVLPQKYGSADKLITYLRSCEIYPYAESIYCGDYTMVLIPIGSNNHIKERDDLKAKLVSVVEEFIQREQEVHRFLRDIEACAAGSKFALKYKNMRQVWHAMIVDEEWDYMDYVVRKLTECTVEEARDKFDYVLAYDAPLELLGKLRRLLGAHFSRNLTPPFLEKLNPFARRTDD